MLNFIVDPLWLFNHSNKFNQKQGSYDERQLKSNYLYYNLKDNFDGILLGSSRATYVDQNDFENMKIFNYSVGAKIGLNRTTMQELDRTQKRSLTGQ